MTTGINRPWGNEMTPVVIRRSRRKASKLVSPNGLPIVCASRPGVFGNPFTAKDAEAAGYPDGATMAVWATVN
jgi:hypothetical protein